MTTHQSSDFTEWLSQLPRVARGAFIFSAIGTITSVIVPIWHFVRGTDSLKLKGAICAIEALVIVCLLLLTLHGPNRFYKASSDDEIRDSFGYGDHEKWMEAKGNALHSLGQFRNFWNVMWLAWFFLYVGLGCKYLLANGSGSAMIVFSTFADMSHAVVILMAVLCYLSLTMPARVGSGEAETVNLNWPPWAVLFCLILVLQVGAKYISASMPDLFAGWNVKAADVSTGIDLFHSGLGGLAMSLFFGRLGIKFLKAPAWFLIMMNFYAAIHITYAFWGKPYFEPFEFIAIGLMLIFKIFLFLFVTWMFGSGRLLFYFMKVQQIREHEDRDWAAFKKIISPAVPEGGLLNDGQGVKLVVHKQDDTISGHDSHENGPKSSNG